MVSWVLAAASSTKCDPESTMRCNGPAVPRNIVPSSLTTVERSVGFTESTVSLIRVSSTSLLIGRLLASPLRTSPAWAYGALSSGGSKSRYCSPTAERLCTYILVSSGILASCLSVSFATRPVLVTRMPVTLPTLTPR